MDEISPAGRWVQRIRWQGLWWDKMAQCCVWRAVERQARLAEANHFGLQPANGSASRPYHE
jgi:hypothetical protein